MTSYDIDEFEELMQSSRMGGWNMRSLRMCRSLPSSPKRSPDRDFKGGINITGDTSITEGTQETKIYSNMLGAPDPYQDVQFQSNELTSGGARPKIIQLPNDANTLHTGLPATGGIRRTQSCRRPAATRREIFATKQENIDIKRVEPTPKKEHNSSKKERTPSYRKRAHANAWRHHANMTSTDEETENKPTDESPTDESEQLNQPKDDEEELQECKIYRVRSFRTTSGGIVNHGDSFKVKSQRQSSKHRTPRSIHGRRFSTDTNDSLSSRDDVMSDSPMCSPKVLAIDSPGPSRPTMLNIQDSPKTDSLMPYDNRLQELIQEDASLKLRRQSMNSYNGWSGSPILEPEIEEEDYNGDDGDDTEEDNSVYKVLMIGTQGVGKSTLTRQLLTSEYLANTDRYQGMYFSP